MTWKLKTREPFFIHDSVRLIFENEGSLFTVTLVKRTDVPEGSRVRILAHYGTDVDLGLAQYKRTLEYAYVEYIPMDMLPVVLSELSLLIDRKAAVAV